MAIRDREIAEIGSQVLRTEIKARMRGENTLQSAMRALNTEVRDLRM